MTKQKIGVIVGSSLAALLLAGGGFWLGTSHHTVHASANLDGAASIPGNDGQASSTSTSTPTAAHSAGMLSVNSGGTSAGSLGQLGGSNSGQSSSGSSNSAGSSSGSSSSSQAIDPSTFAQYDKYKDQTQALFGDVQKGSGATLTANKKAVVYYKGWLTNGQMFDESRTDSSGHMQAFSFTLGAHQVISGWEEGLAGMQVGGTRLVVVPPSVGYGAQGQGSIPPNAVLVFEVQLVDVQ